MNYYCVEYKIEDRGTVSLTSITPHSDYVDNLFWTGVLFRDVCLDHDGEYRMHMVVCDEGKIHKGFIEKHVGWQRFYGEET